MSNISHSANITTTLSSLLAIIAHSLQTVRSPNPPSALTATETQSTPKDVNVYSLLHDLSSLTKAHATKLGLITRHPFVEHAAASRILQEFSTQIVPSLVTAAQQTEQTCTCQTFNKAVREAIAAVLQALHDFTVAIPLDMTKFQGKSEEQINSTILKGTGVIWSTSDGLNEVARLQVIGIVTAKVALYDSMLSDAILEFREWLDNGLDDGEDSGFEDDVLDLDDASPQDILEAPKPPPSKEMKVAAEASMKKLKLAGILFSAIGKRRLKGADRIKDDQGKKLDIVCELARSISEVADDVAAAWYDGEIDDAREAQKILQENSVNLADCCRLNGEGKEDKYSLWFDKFKDNMMAVDDVVTT